MEKNKRKKNYRLSVLVRLKTQNRLNILSSIVSRIDLNEIAKHLGFIYIDLKWKITEKKCNPVKMQLGNEQEKKVSCRDLS